MLPITTIDNLTVAQLPPVTVLSGEDSGQYTILKEKLLAQVGYNPGDLTYSYFDLSQVAYAEAALDLESLPFFSDQKIVIFDQFLDLTTVKKSYLDEKDLKAFEEYLSNPVESTRLIICAPGKLDGKRRLVKLLKKKASLIEATPVKEADLRTYMANLLQASELEVSAADLEVFLEKSQFDFATALQNKELLIQVKGRGPVDAKDIRDILPRSLQDDIFLLSRYLLQKEIDQARQLTQDLVMQGQDEVKLLAVLLGQFRMYYQVGLLVKAGKSESQMISLLSDALGRKVNPYQVKFAIRDSRGLSLKQLRHCMLTLIETDYGIKTGQYEKAYLFDVALLKMVCE
ncbi:DNA polymerase III subunit delta [Streptococcus sp. DD12]|uniref:DNA polymerase III subunit delta n=1 Tax=Streptococcus sp. DD12 TaxID=1777880 RepID=UPI000799AF5D|nr:DNA polymerase III subunit delta [Streptococcus sp. DD12]KXT76891.1 DNA polymerase III delta subunit [Streptococcus sp. DD12]